MYGEFIRDASNNAQRVAVGVITLAGLLFAFAWLSPGVATPEQAIVVHGSDSGSHLRLQVVGGAISVQGSLKPGGQVGCEGYGNHLTCPVAGAGVIEVRWDPRTTRSRSSTACRSP